MGHPRRYFVTGTPYFVTNRVAEGLPFVATLYINLFLFGILARACFLYRTITLCFFLFMTNHYHLLLVLRGDPQQLERFMHYVNSEIAKLVVRWTGKRNVKIWAQRYHAIPVLTSEDCLKEMLYTFLNPVRAGLVGRAIDWRGCSSLYSLSDSTPRNYSWLKLNDTRRLPNARFSRKIAKGLLKGLSTLCRPMYSLPLDPFGWMECFPDTAGKSVDEMRDRLCHDIARTELRCARVRKVKNQGIVGADALAEQNPHKPYKPSKFGRRMWCVSRCLELKIAYLALYKALCKEARKAWQAWCRGYIDAKVPHGMFSPPRPPRGSVISMFGYA